MFRKKLLLPRGANRINTSCNAAGTGPELACEIVTWFNISPQQFATLICYPSMHWDRTKQEADAKRKNTKVARLVPQCSIYIFVATVLLDHLLLPLAEGTERQCSREGQIRGLILPMLEL